MMAEVLSNYKYVRKPETNAKEPAEALAPHSSLCQNIYSENNTQYKPTNPDSE